MQNVAHAYLQTQVGTTGQGEIVVMLFDGALRFLAQARDKMQAKDYAGKGQLISRALDIVNELDSSLNMEVGGELAKNLHQLYFLCTTRLLQANLKLDMDKLDSVVEILSGTARRVRPSACHARSAGRLRSTGGQTERASRFHVPQRGDRSGRARLCAQIRRGRTVSSAGRATANHAPRSTVARSPACRVRCGDAPPRCGSARPAASGRAANARSSGCARVGSPNRRIRGQTSFPVRQNHSDALTFIPLSGVLFRVPDRFPEGSLPGGAYRARC